VIAHLLRTKRRILRNYLRAEDGGVKQAVAIALFGLSFWFGLLFGAEWFLSRVYAMEPIGVVMMRRMTGLVLLFLFSIGTFSNLIAAFSTYYLADDLFLLMQKPIPPESLYGARFAENAINASWMTVTFAAPYFLALGWVMHAPPGYWLSTLAVLFALGVMPCAVATLISLLLTFPFSARRARQVLVFSGTAIFATLFVLLRQLEPERFLNPDNRAPMIEALEAVQGGESAWLPSTWALDALWGQLSRAAEIRTHPVALLLSASLAAYFIAGWAFRRWHWRAYSSSREGMDIREEIGERRRKGKGRTLAELVAAREKRDGGPDLRAVLRAKDLRAWLRDTAQWSQALLIAALIVIYVVNFRYIRSVSETGIFTQRGLHFTNLALSAFVAVAICVRFGFPAVSLEGRAFWLVLRSPIAISDFLYAKWRSMAWPLLILLNALVFFTNISLDSGWFLTLTAAVVCSFSTYGSLGLALGIGAQHPRFKIDNAAKIATGFGGLLYMGQGITLALASTLLSVYPTLVVARWLDHGELPGLTRVALGLILAVLTLGGPLLLARRALRKGATSLRKRGV
jgi:ABC-2 type transport system permease protein